MVSSGLVSQKIASALANLGLEPNIRNMLGVLSRREHRRNGFVITYLSFVIVQVLRGAGRIVHQ